MKKIQYHIIFLVIFSIVGINWALAQNNNEEASLDQGNIEGQFDYTINKSSKYQEYRVVKTAWLYKLKSNVLDSISALQNEIAQLGIKIDSLNQHISSVTQDLINTQDELDQTIRSKNSIPFLGMEIQKGKYNAIMWSLVIILLLAGAFLFLLFKRSNYVTKQMQEKYADLEKEFEAHRQRVLEKEKRIARQHLNEINKLRGRQ
ncbi:hypothetical protein [Thermophagus xiamenensis]|uniref:tRNA (Guanine-N1)-methyltransferase n=1 Tax=Thermophagus xiamenensis TaxID=385682 RepID=A0A1I1UMD5_9BACT|nr:hypothetical protein [Thermophagus xiamenensis]SFD71991.1 hypothetical protein SAMN05444380_101133 [Thermophagus xiamenensis]